MKAGYSKLLISNIIMSGTNPRLRHIHMDLAMLALSGGKQRTMAEWSALVGSVGLAVAKIWEPKGDSNGIVECELDA